MRLNAATKYEAYDEVIILSFHQTEKLNINPEKTFINK